MQACHGRVLCALLGAVVIASQVPGASAQVPQQRLGPSFVDDFSKLDRKRWIISDGWSNGGHQHCTWSAANVRRGPGTIFLVLNNKRGRDKPFSCAELQSKEFYRFGTFEARLRPAAGTGIVSAFFVFARSAPGQGQVAEHVSFEFVGKDRKQVLLTYAEAGANIYRKTIDFDFEPSETMIDYAFQWTPTALRWFVGRRLVHQVQDPSKQLPGLPARIFLSIRNGAGSNEEEWLGTFSYNREAFVTTIEHIAYTELGGQCQFPASIVCAQKRALAPQQ